jgi:hypothetical protein
MDFNKFRKEQGGTDVVPTNIPEIDTKSIWTTCVAIAKEYTKFLSKDESVRQVEQAKIRKKYSAFVSSYPILANKLFSGPENETMQTRLENVKDMLDKIKSAQNGSEKIESLHVKVGQEYWNKYNGGRFH